MPKKADWDTVKLVFCARLRFGFLQRFAAGVLTRMPGATFVLGEIKSEKIKQIRQTHTHTHMNKIVKRSGGEAP